MGNEVPESFKLYQNYPNPFNPVTIIKFNIPNVETTQRVVSARLVIYDIAGREAATLLNDRLKPGSYEVQWDAADCPSGVYFYKLMMEGYSETRKMVLLK